MLLLAFAAFLVVPLEREFPQGDSYCASVNDIQYCFPLFPCYFYYYIEEELAAVKTQIQWWMKVPSSLHYIFSLPFRYVDYMVPIRGARYVTDFNGGLSKA